MAGEIGTLKQQQVEHVRSPISPPEHVEGEKPGFGAIHTKPLCAPHNHPPAAQQRHPGEETEGVERQTKGMQLGLSDVRNHGLGATDRKPIVCAMSFEFRLSRGNSPGGRSRRADRH